MEPPPRPRPERTRTDWEKDFKLCEHTAAEWEAQRPEFQKLYLQKNLKLPEIRKIMAQNHGFYANKRQFDRKIKEWGLNKNLKRKDAIIMLKKQNERLAAEGKRTEFTFNGLPVTMEKLQRHVSGFQPGDSPAAATPDYVEYWTPRNPDPGTPSELYGTPRVDNDSTPMKQNPETPRPHFTHYQPVNSFDHDIQSPLGTYTNPVYIDGEDTEMVDAENIPPGPELVFPANPTIESQHEEDYNPISSPPRSQYTNSTIMSTTTMGAEKVPGIVDRSSESRNSLNTSLGLEKTGIERSPSYRTTHNSEREDNIQRLCQLLHRKSFSEQEVFPLIESGSGLYAQCSCCSKSPLHLAAQDGHEAVARLLLEKGADVSALEVDTYTPLHLAALNGHGAVARLLLEKGADVSALQVDSWTPLHLAALNGHEAVARLLLEKGADVSALQVISYTPLHIAAQNGHEAVACLLLEKGADASALEKQFSQTPLHIAAQNGHEAVARLLLEKGADVSPLQVDSWTSLHLAVENGHEAVSRLLLEKGADVSALQVDSWTPLHIAALNGYEAVARLLLEKGADVSALQVDSYTPLHLAAQNGHEAVARLLVERGADPLMKSHSGITPLQVAVRNKRNAIVPLLEQFTAAASRLAPWNHWQSRYIGYMQY